jgi:polynucleotide 5'-hydroxyl-kinase GRC3/NOL9
MTPRGEKSDPVQHFPFLARMEILPAWEDAAGQFLKAGGPVMVLGAPDTGKSSLSRYLLYRAFIAGKPAALVDLDVGQSHLGPPGALGLALYPPRLPGDDSLFPDSLWFIGQTSPVGAILEVSVGCRVLADEAARQGVRHLVVNTSGLVAGPAALLLKKAQVELLRPPLLLGLERDGELTPLLRGLVGKEADEIGPGTGHRGPGAILVRLPVSSRVIRRSPEDRRRYREERFRRYFQKGRRLALPWPALVWDGQPWGLGEALAAPELADWSRRLGVPALYGERRERRVFVLLERPLPENHRDALQAHPEEEAVHWISWESLQLRLAGLLDGGHRTLALGIILPGAFDPPNLALWTPLAPNLAPRVRFIKLGKMRLTPEGQELV